MKNTTKAMLGTGVALIFGAGALYAHPDGYGPGYGMRAPGYGMGAGYGMGPGYGMGHGMGPGFGMTPMGYGPGMGRGYADPGAAADARLQGMKSQLGITGNQEQAWNAFAEAARQQSADMQKWRETMLEASRSGAGEQMKVRSEMMKQRAAQMERASSAFQTLYTALSAEQRTLLDRRRAAYR